MLAGVHEPQLCQLSLIPDTSCLCCKRCPVGVAASMRQVAALPYPLASSLYTLRRPHQCKVEAILEAAETCVEDPHRDGWASRRRSMVPSQAMRDDAGNQHWITQFSAPAA